MEPTTVRVKIRKYGSLPSCAYWGAYDADGETTQPLDLGVPTAFLRRKRDVVARVAELGWEVAR